MSTNSPAVLIQGASIAGSITTYYTAPANTKVRINQMTLANTDSVARVVSIYLGLNSSVGTATDLVATIPLAPGQSYSVYQAINQVMNTLGTIQAVCDAATVVTLKASGTLIVG